MKMAVYGAGSMGMIVGTLLAKARRDVVLIDINEPHVRALNEKGGRITGFMDIVQPVKAALPSEVDETFDYIVYLTKPTQNESAFPDLARMLKPDGTVIVGQNGMPEEAVAEVVGADRVVGMIIGWGATWVEPGVSKLTSPVELMDFHFGELNDEVTERIVFIQEIFNEIGIAHLSPSLLGGRYAKLIINCCFSSTGTLVNGTFGDAVDNPKGLRCVAHIYNEAMAIAHAAQIKPEPIVEGFEFDALVSTTNEELEELLPVFKFLVTEHRNIKPQLLFDMAAGRFPEINTTYNGILLKWGERYSVPTPVNRQVVAVITDMANGLIPVDSSNVDLIELPDLP